LAGSAAALILRARAAAAGITALLADQRVVMFAVLFANAMLFAGLPFMAQFFVAAHLLLAVQLLIATGLIVMDEPGIDRSMVGGVELPGMVRRPESGTLLLSEAWTLLRGEAGTPLLGEAGAIPLKTVDWMLPTEGRV
jgi:hypothetical protein